MKPTREMLEAGKAVLMRPVTPHRMGQTEVETLVADMFEAMQKAAPGARARRRLTWVGLALALAAGALLGLVARGVHP